MAFTLVSLTNQYNPNYENLAPDDLLRRAQQGQVQADAGVKALGRAQYIAKCTTTAADAGSVVFTFGNAQNTRSFNDETASPSNQLTQSLAGVDVTTAGLQRKVDVELTYNDSTNTARHTALYSFFIIGAATPTVIRESIGGATLLAAGVPREASAITANLKATVDLVAVAGGVQVQLTGTAATNIAETIKVTIGDPILN